MKPKHLFVIGLGVGYIVGARAGRERFEQLKSGALDLWESPRVAKTRRDLEAYARQQAPIIVERAEAAAKAAPGVIADGAKKTADVARDVAGKTANTAKDVAGKTATTAKDVAEKTATVARDVAGKTASTAKDVAEDVRGQVTRTAADLRTRGEDVVERATLRAGAARDEILEDDLDEDDDAPRS